jgi:Arc/MetJ family transcription regulator
MPELDGFAVLRAIGENPDAFGEIDAAVAKAARELVIKRLKSKSLAVDDARAVREAVGYDMFDRIVEGMPAAHLKSIVSKLDKHHPDMKRSSAQWQRQHLQTLLEGAAEPTQKSAKSKKTGQAKTAGTPPTPIGFRTEAMSVFRESLKRK